MVENFPEGKKNVSPEIESNCPGLASANIIWNRDSNIRMPCWRGHQHRM